MARSGILLVDKEPGMTSHDVVSRTRKLAGTRKVGHAGTLDPMATGLLVLGLNSSTRLLTFVVGLDKEYFGTIRLGVSTDTDDAEGDPTSTTDASHLERPAIDAALGTFVGEIEQVPSSVSAIRINGRRAYDLHRAGEDVELAARTITITELEVLGSRPDGAFVDVDVRVVCSSGTYIRAIARDLGGLLGVGGHLTALRRTRIGPFSIDDAVELSDGLDVESRMLPPATVASTLYPVRTLDHDETIDLVHGKRIPAEGFTGHDGPIAAIGPTGVLVGIVEAKGERLKPIVNFPSDEARA